MAKIRLRHGENEIELEGDADFIKNQLEAFYEKVKPVAQKEPPRFLKEKLLTHVEEENPISEMTPAEYYKSKGKTDGISTILIFGKFLEVARGITEFKRSDINGLAKEAKIAKDVHSQYLTNAVKQGLLRVGTGGRYSLTLSAEEVLSSM